MAFRNLKLDTGLRRLCNETGHLLNKYKSVTLDSNNNNTFTLSINNIADNKVRIVTSYKYPFQKPDIFVNDMEYSKFLKLDRFGNFLLTTHFNTDSLYKDCLINNWVSITDLGQVLEEFESLCFIKEIINKIKYCLLIKHKYLVNDIPLEKYLL